MKMRRFACILCSGIKVTRATYRTCTAYDAARQFIAEHFPAYEIDGQLQHERPEHRPDGEIFSRWSAGTTASGQRLYIIEVD